MGHRKRYLDIVITRTLNRRCSISTSDLVKKGVAGFTSKDSIVCMFRSVEVACQIAFHSSRYFCRNGPSRKRKVTNTESADIGCLNTSKVALPNSVAGSKEIPDCVEVFFMWFKMVPDMSISCLSLSILLSQMSRAE